jgi:hypothetical protein
MALRFGERYYRLAEIVAPAGPEARWTYHLEAWPDGEVFRRIVDYEQDCAERAAVQAGKLSSKLQRWISGKKE